MNQHVSYRYLYELLGLLEKNDKSESDVLWAGNTSYQIPWEEFKNLLSEACESTMFIESHREYIPEDLIVVGQHFLIRLLEDGSGCWDPIWEYIAVPAMPQTTIRLKSLILPEELRKPYVPHTLEEQVKFEKKQYHSNS